MPAIRRELRELDRLVEPFEIRTMENHLNASQFEQRVAASVSTTFGVLALLLATVGIYGMISYSVRRRTHEIGIRIALGAGTGQLLALLMLHGLGITAAGVVLGFALALGLARFIAVFLPGVGVTDPGTFVVAALLCAALALIATYLPARCAVRLNPMTALSRE